MAFAENTGRIEQRRCKVCGTEVEHEEVRHFTAPASLDWHATAHRAPCGAHCGGGGYDHGETDVHIPAFGRCPRCGATETEIADVITRADQNERVVFHRYVVDYHRFIGYRIDLEVFRDGAWGVKSRWNTNFPDSLPRTIEWAERYVPWLRNEKKS
jgi:hypothetical protein